MDQLTVLVDSIAEDSHDLLTAQLAARGVASLSFRGGGELCDVIHRVKVAGVFLNWSTRYGGGSDPVRQLRRSPSNKHVPLTMLADSAATSVVAEAARQGVDFFLSKPLSDAQVERMFARLLPLMMEERRTYRRVQLSMPVLCSWSGAARPLTGETVNVSSSGMLLHLDPQPPVGTRVELAFGIADLSHEFVLGADVVRQVGARVGLRYDWQSPDLRETLKARLDALA